MSDDTTTPAAPFVMPRMGETVIVQIKPGSLLRRLQDGDLELLSTVG